MNSVYGSYSFGIIGLLILSINTPVFAEVTSLQTNSELFQFGDKIKINGIVDQGSNGLVSIVIRDSNDEFVLLTQTTINHDNSFEKIIDVGEDFTAFGMHSATGFILNMTKGITTNFEITQFIEQPIKISEQNEETIIIQEEPKKDDDQISDKIIESKIQESETVTKIADFVDTNKDPQYYIDRYYNEPSYKSWFDRNYPNLTIEDAVGYNPEKNSVKTQISKLMEKEIIPEAQAASIVKSNESEINNSDIAQISLALAGLGILFGAVYGVKRKADDNYKQISINKETIKRKLILPKIRSNPKEILQMRLVKGEISLEEYEKLNSKLD